MKKSLIYCVIAIAAFGCNSEKNGGESSDVSENISVQDTLVEKKIKTADMHFTVKDVQSTKEKIGVVIAGFGGELTEFSMHSTIQQTEKVKYSADSLLELTSYTKEGFINASVPTDKIDEFTNKVAKMALFVDDQSMKIEDLSGTYLSNVLKNENKLEAVDELTKYATKKNNQIDKSLDLKNDYVDKKVENLLIEGRVENSTITLSFHQPVAVKQLMISNDNLADYRPGFFTRFGLSFQNGWGAFKEFLLFMTNLWVLLIAIGAGYFMYRHYHHKVKSIG